MDESLDCGEFKKILGSNKIIVIGAKFCKACINAKKLLTKSNFDYLDYDILEKEQISSCLYQKTQNNFIPQIFVNKKFIGGLNELTYLIDSKLLEDIVEPKL
jgi:glutaredoxin